LPKIKAGEILESREREQDASTIGLALGFLRDIAGYSLEAYDTDRSASERKLKRILRIYRAASSSSACSVVRERLDVSYELHLWLLRQSRSSKDPEEKTIWLLRFLADEATPIHVLEAAHIWTVESELVVRIEMLLRVLQTLLRRNM